MHKAEQMRLDRERRKEAALKAYADEKQIGTFRLKTSQSHTRFEGLERRRRHTYYGNGHSRAAPGGDVIRFTASELERFPDARQRFELVDADKGGKWHKPVDEFDAEIDDTPEPDKVGIILAHRVDKIEELIQDLDERDLRAVLKSEFGERGRKRKGVRDAVEELLDDADDD